MASKKQKLPTPVELATLAQLTGDSDPVRGMRRALDMCLLAESELNAFAERERKRRQA